MKKLLAIFCLLCAGLSAQTTDTLTATANGQSGSAVITLLPKSTDSFSVSTSSIAVTAGSTASFSISAATTRLEPAGLQFNISAPSAVVSAFNITVGSAATAASKTISCAATPSLPAGTIGQTCIIAGLNQNSIVNGVIANVGVTVAAGATGSGVITVSNPSAVNVAGNTITATIASGNVTLAVAATVSVTCAADPNTLTPTANTIEPGEVINCSATLSSAATTNTTVTLTATSTTSPGITIPTSVTIAGGSAGVTFQVTGI